MGERRPFLSDADWGQSFEYAGGIEAMHLRIELLRQEARPGALVLPSHAETAYGRWLLGCLPSDFRP